MSDLVYFSCFTTLIGLGLAVCFHVMVGVESEAYSTVSGATASLFMMLLGEFDSETFRDTSQAFIACALMHARWLLSTTPYLRALRSLSLSLSPFV